MRRIPSHGVKTRLKMIIRNPNRERYVIISKVGLEDDRLSWKARGLLAYLLSKPDNWEVMQAHLVKQGPDGTASVRAGLNELKEAGYITSAKSKNDSGRFDGWDSFVYEEPVTEMRFQHVGKPTDGKTDVRKSHPNEQLLSMKNEEMKNEDNESDVKTSQTFSSEVIELVSLLQRHVIENGSNPFIENKAAFASVDRLIRIDKRSPEQVRTIIEWSQQHDFWVNIIHSPANLRKQFDTMLGQAIGKNRGLMKFLQDSDNGQVKETEFKWA
jgi:hypothetical protein